MIARPTDDATPTLADATASESAVAAEPTPPNAAPTRGVVRGSVWTVIGFGGTQVLRFISNIVLARFLLPEHFGLMALVNVFLLGLEMLSDVGIGSSLIQNRRGDDVAFRNTAWSIQVARGLILGGCALVGAWPMAWYLERSELAALIPVAGITAIVAGFNSTGLFTARRHLRIAEVTTLEVAAQIGGMTVMWTWAAIAPSVWTLVGGTLTVAVLKMFGSHLLREGPRNRFAWEPSAVGELMRFGKWIMLSTLITFCALHGDKLVLSKLLDGTLATDDATATLGVYSMATAIATLPVYFIGSLSGSILFPVLSRFAHGDRVEFQRRLTSGRGALLGVTLVLVLGVYAESPLFFRHFYSAKYQLAAAITPRMTPWIWLATLASTLEWTVLALGETRTLAMANLVKFVVTTAASIAGYLWLGLDGFLAGLACGALAGYAAITVALVRNSVRVLSQDIPYTLGAIALAATVHFASLPWSASSPWVAEGIRAALVAAVGLWSLRQLRGLLRARRSAAVV